MARAFSIPITPPLRHKFRQEWDARRPGSIYIAIMIALQKVDDIATEVARRYLGKDNVVRANSRPYVDYEGADALRIEIVLGPGAPKRMKGNKLLKTLSGIRRRLEEDGDDRFPFLKYATTDELTEHGDLQS